MSQARNLVDTARRSKRFLMEALYTRHLPAIAQVRAWIMAGSIGDVRMAQATRCATGEYNPASRHMNLALGGGSLLDVGIYPLSFLCMAFRDTPEAAHGHALIGETGADEHGSAVLRFPGGGIGTMHFGLHTNAIDDARIYGTDGYITIESPFWGATRATLVRYEQADEYIDYPIEGNGLQFEASETMRCKAEAMTFSGTLKTPAICRAVAGWRRIIPSSPSGVISFAGPSRFSSGAVTAAFGPKTSAS